MRTVNKSCEYLLAENEDLRSRLEEAEAVLAAIKSGEVDALVVSRPEGEQIFTLQGAETPYRVLVESMNEGAAILSADGTILYCNSRLAAMLEVPLADLTGTSLGSYVSPRDFAFFACRLGTCGEENDKREISLITGGGKQLTALFSCCGVELSGRRETGIVLADISALKKVTRELKAANELIEMEGQRLYAVLETLPAMICLITPDYHIPFANKSFRDRFGEANGRRCYEYCFGKSEPCDFCESFNVFNTGNPHQWECIYPDGTIISAHDFPFTDADGTPLILEMNIDITDHRRTEKALREMNATLERRVAERTTELRQSHENLEAKVIERTRELREKDQMLITQSRQAAMGEMLGNIAHQWRQPLNSVGLIMQTLTFMYDAGQLEREALVSMEKKVMELVHHMSKTIDDFRNYFRPDKEKVTFHIGNAVQRTLSLVEASFKDRSIATELRMEDDPAITGFQNEYAQALLNILQNARDVLESRKVNNPQVSVVVGSENGKSVVTITDNAGGIPDEIIHKIFDPYFTTKGPDKGTGVGLFMSRAIIEKNMGGRLTVRNTGDGAEFRIEV